MSGILPSDDAIEAFKRVKAGQDAWAVFAVCNEKTVEAIHAVTADADHRGTAFSRFESDIWAGLVDWVAANMTNRTGYIILSMKKVMDGIDQSRLSVISWCPETGVKVKAKMLHGSALNAVKQTFEGIEGKPVQAGSIEDLQLVDVYAEVGL